jgi:TolB-like protein
MSEHRSRFKRFWQELKRRNVIRVMAMYAGTAYIIMEGSDIMLPRLGLPDWTVTLVIVLLLAGLPVTLILSWIFDVTPEGLKKTGPEEFLTGEEQGGENPPRQLKRRGLRVSDGIIVVLFAAVCVLLYPRIFGKDQFKAVRDEDGRISVTVLPFENMTGDSLLNIWQEGIQEGIIIGLSESKELSVRSFQSVRSALSGYYDVNHGSLTSAMARDASEKLESSTYIRGSILAAGRRIRINERLVNAGTDEIIKTFRVEGDAEEDLLKMIDSLAWLNRNFLEIKAMEDEELIAGFIDQIQTQSSEAYRNLIASRELFVLNQYEPSIRYLDRALEIDSSFSAARLQRAFAYHNMGERFEGGGNIIKSRELHRIALRDLEILEAGLNEMPFINQCLVRYLRSDYDKDPWEGIRQLESAMGDAPNSHGMEWWQLGLNCFRVDQKERAIECFEKALEGGQRMEYGSKWVYLYTMPAIVYHEKGNHAREKEILDMGLKAIPSHPSLIGRQVVCAYSRNDTLKARELGQKYRVIRRNEGTEEPWIRFSMGYIYSEAGWHDSALVAFRRVEAQFSQVAACKDALGRELILSGKDVARGVELCAEAVKAEPLNWNYQVHLGNGYLIQDSLEKARVILQKAWDERTFFDPENYKLLSEVKEALETRGRVGN